MKYLSLICVMLLSACVGDALQSNMPPVARYVVHPATLDISLEEQHILKVEKVNVADVLDTDEMVLLEANRRVHYLESAHWVAPLPDMLQELMVDSLSTVGNLTVITADDTRIKADYRLKLHVSDAYALYDVAGQGTPTLHMKGKSMLIDARSNKIISTLSFDERLATKENSATAIAEAFEQQWQELALRIAKLIKD